MVNPNEKIENTGWVPSRKMDKSRQDVERTRPEGSPNSDKDFKKIVAGRDDRKSSPKKTSKMSADESSAEDIAEEEHAAALMQSPSQIYRSLSEDQQMMQRNYLAEAKAKRQLADASSKKSQSDFALQAQDLTAVNPLGSTALQSSIGAISGIQSDLQTQQANSQQANLQEIVDQIITKIYTLKVNGQTDTVMTLRYPPLLEGATLAITSYDAARGQFNITFSDLTAQAKAFLDQQQSALRHALEEGKGFVVHIVIITTGNENPLAKAENSDAYRQDQRNNKQGQSGQQRQQQQKEG